MYEIQDKKKLRIEYSVYELNESQHLSLMSLLQCQYSIQIFHPRIWTEEVIVLVPCTSKLTLLFRVFNLHVYSIDLLFDCLVISKTIEVFQLNSWEENTVWHTCWMSPIRCWILQPYLGESQPSTCIFLLCLNNINTLLMVSIIVYCKQ